MTRRALMRSAFAAAAAAAIAACAPRRRPPARSAEPEPTMPFERIAYGPAPQQFGDLRRPASSLPSPVVMVIHGGAWQAESGLGVMLPVCEALARDGYATWNVEYRRVGDPGGGWPGTFLDVGTAADRLKTLGPQHGLDLRRVVVLGHSAGGPLALWCAGRRWIRDGELRTARPIRVRGALSLAGIVDLRRAWEMHLGGVGELMGGSPEQVPGRYQTGDPAALIPIGVPQVLVHGQADTVVPLRLSADYARAAKARGDDARLIELPGVGHLDLIDPAVPAWGTVGESVRTLVV